MRPRPSSTIRHAWIGFLILVSFGASTAAQDYGFRPVWPELTPQERASVMAFVREAVRFAESRGFKPWTSDLAPSALFPGSRWYAVNRDRTLALFVIGSEPIEAGMRIVNTHIDSPRLEFKTRPFRERSGAVTIDAQVHGGIKNYQWANVPLALTGRVDGADGTTVWIEVGVDPDDPVLLITDLAPHVDADYRDRTAREVIRTEELEPIAASLPVEKDGDHDAATDRFLALLEEQYGIEARDFLSASIQIVPATAPRDVGLDRALVGAYGQDDRSTGYVSLRAIAEIGTPRHTAVAYAVDNEETPSWNTGVNSEWFTAIVSELIAAQNGSFDGLRLRRAYRNTDVLVSDTNPAFNPLFPGAQNPDLASRLGYGMVVSGLGAGREAHSEFIARIRKMLDEAGVRWQTHDVEAGSGGGTIAGGFANQNMDVIDVGVGIVSMHSPFEVSSKADLWELRKGFLAFFNQ